jgi:hypothetical protein
MVLGRRSGFGPVKPGDLICIKPEYYTGCEFTHIPGVLVQPVESNVVWGSEPDAPQLWEVLVDGKVRRIWDTFLEKGA